MGSFGNTTFKTKSSFGDPFITIYNDTGKEIVVHRDMIDMYLQTPPGLLGKMANTISAERELEVGYIDENQELQKENISLSEKYIFASTEEEDDILPELVHAKNVELIGEVTRGNSSTNRLGIKYKEKILTCIPEKGDIKQYKNCIFRKCRIYGIVSREDEFGNITEKKPKIIFYKLIPIDEVPATPNLFNIQQEFGSRGQGSCQGPQHIPAGKGYSRAYIPVSARQVLYNTSFCLSWVIRGWL